MTETITPQQFHEAAGIEDWRVLTNVAHAHFRTGSFAPGVALVGAIRRLADAADHRPDVDLRADGVTVRLTTTTQDHFFWLSERDVELARQISAAARELDVPAPERRSRRTHGRDATAWHAGTAGSLVPRERVTFPCPRRCCRSSRS